MSNISKTKDFIKKLQEKEEKTKRVYLIAASSVSMIVIIALWIAYLNLTIPPAETAGVEASTTPTTTINYLPQQTPQPSGNSFFTTLGRGFSAVYSGAAGGAGNAFGQINDFFSNLGSGLRKELQKTNTFSIQKGDETTTQAATDTEPATGTLEAIPPTPLP